MASCSLVSGPNLHNLKLSSVGIIDPSRPADAARDGVSPWPDRTVLAINFTAERNLAEYAKQYEYNIGNDASFCRADEVDPTSRLQNNPYVYDALGKVDAFRDSHPSTTSTLEPQATYHVYIAVTPMPLAGRDQFDYDLQSRPEDICVQLRGGNMLGNRFVSNAIVVPKAEIASAVARWSE
jgi:hypothetical protein